MGPFPSSPSISPTGPAHAEGRMAPILRPTPFANLAFPIIAGELQPRHPVLPSSLSSLVLICMCLRQRKGWNPSSKVHNRRSSPSSSSLLVSFSPFLPTLLVILRILHLLDVIRTWFHGRKAGNTNFTPSHRQNPHHRCLLPLLHDALVSTCTSSSSFISFGIEAGSALACTRAESPPSAMAAGEVLVTCHCRADEKWSRSCSHVSSCLRARYIGKRSSFRDGSPLPCLPPPRSSPLVMPRSPPSAMNSSGSKRSLRALSGSRRFPRILTLGRFPSCVAT